MPLRRIHARAPVRVCDCGGWTDTWFARHGHIFNIAVLPGAEVQLDVIEHVKGEPRVLVHAENFGETIEVRRGQPWTRHALIEAAVLRMLPGQSHRHALRITLFSEVPSGAGTGTSAAITVALLAALDRARDGKLTPHELAYEAHEVETVDLGRQCGIQDQLCAAHGGICDIAMHDYPYATVNPVPATPATLAALERRLALVYLGRQHDSSQIHARVIRELEDAGPEDVRIADLRATARRARDAFAAADFTGLGAAMTANTEAQARLNPALVCDDARAIQRIAAAHGALGCKVNGAGGDGGSLTLLCDDAPSRTRALLRDITRAVPAARAIPIRLSPEGVQTWDA